MSHSSQSKFPLTSTPSTGQPAISYRRYSTKEKHPQDSLPFWQRMLYNRVFHFAILVGLCSFIGIGIPIIWSNYLKLNPSTTIESDLRYNCYPLRPTEKVKSENCPKHNCQWDNKSIEMDIPCYYKMKLDNNNEDIFPSYIAEKIDDLNYKLRYQHLDNFFLDKNNNNLVNGSIVEQNLTLSISYYHAKHMSVLIKPEDEVPENWNDHFHYPVVNNSLYNSSDSFLQYSVSKEKNFQLMIKRVENSKDNILFDMGQHSPFIFADGLREITTALPNELIFGIGQSNLPTFRHNFTTQQKWQLFSQYSNNITENTTTLFGSHPFYLGIDDDGGAYGVLFLNSFPIEVSTNARPTLTFRTIGGQFEFHFFAGENPQDVMIQLQKFIYRPAMPPYWALGFHICQTLCQVPSNLMAINTLHDANIPVESDCGTALRTINDYRSFQSFKIQLEAEKMKELKFMSLLPPYIFADSPYQNKWKDQVLLSYNHELYNGTVQMCDRSNALTNDNQVYYPDFFNNQTMEHYQDQVFSFADGYLLDFNTPINIENQLLKEPCREMLERYSWNKFYFKDLNQNNPCMDALLSDAKEDTKSFRDLYIAKHNLYGYKQMQTVHQSWKNQKRPLIMSLSTFIGSGRYGGHLGAPINATWEMLRFALKQTLDFSLFGIPLTGFPVGGFRGSNKRSDELMQRWFQLASILPFMISYSDYNQLQPALIHSVKGMIGSSIQTRYRLLPYFYTLFHKSSKYGSLVVQPLFFEFFQTKDNNANTMDDIYSVEHQFMLGPSLLVSPALEENQNVIRAFFPSGRWYDYYSGHLTWNKDVSGHMDDLSATEQHINLHLRGGHLVPTQEPRNTIAEARRSSGYQIIAAYDKNWYSEGEMYIDDGISSEVYSEHINARFVIMKENITINIETSPEFCNAHSNSAPGSKKTNALNTKLSSIKLYGLIEEPENKKVNISRSNTNEKWTVDSQDVLFEDKFGVLQINVNLDFCNSTSKNFQYFISWAFKKWE